jgi:hypothetical protein
MAFIPLVATPTALDTVPWTGSWVVEALKRVNERRPWLAVRDTAEFHGNLSHQIKPEGGGAF